MKTFLIFLLTFAAIYCTTDNEDLLPKEELGSDSISKPHLMIDPEIIENTIQNIEDTAIIINKLEQLESPPEETELLLKEVLNTLEELVEVLKEPEHTYQFLKSNGIKRSLVPYMNTDNVELKELIFKLLKYLFYEYPETYEVIPTNAIDKLLDTFENDDNLAMKAHALDILYKWLPGNPKAQIRVMILKGLEPFYNQVAKLDISVIATLLDLFNTILNEHIKVLDRNYSSQLDPHNLILYRKIGLIERMSTPSVCKGLLNIIEATWSYSSDDSNDVIAPIFDLIKNMKRYCLKVLRGKNKAVALFETLLKYVENDNKKDYFDTFDLNVTDIKLVLEDFVKELKLSVKDEF